MKHTLEEAIKTAQESLLALEPNWDDEGARPIDKNTLARGIDVLRNIYEITPKIFPAADGGIDIAWRTPEFTLTISFSPKAGEDDVYFKSQEPTGRESLS